MTVQSYHHKRHPVGIRTRRLNMVGFDAHWVKGSPGSPQYYPTVCGAGSVQRMYYII